MRKRLALIAIEVAKDPRVRAVTSPDGLRAAVDRTTGGGLHPSRLDVITDLVAERLHLSKPQDARS